MSYTNNKEFADWCLGSSAIGLSGLPHCIGACRGENGVKYLKSILNTTKSTGAGWGGVRVNLVTESGDFYFDDPLDSISEFKNIWSLEANQKELLKHGAYPSQQFSMVIDLHTPKATLEKLNDPAREIGYGHEECMELVVKEIDGLGWAYIPISDEWYYGLFVTSKRNGQWVEQVARKIKNRSKAVYYIKNAGNHCVFNDKIL